MNNPLLFPSHPLTVTNAKGHIMKTRFLIPTGVLAVVVTLAFLSGCTQQSASNPAAYLITSSPSLAAPQTVAPAPAPALPAAPEAHLANAEAEVVGTPEPIPVSEPIAPANLRLTVAMQEIIRLSHAGVDEGVILTYITNSPGLFLLGAEEIVYLTDLGIASNVITAMLHRDQTLKVAWGNPVIAPDPEPTNVAPVAVAPTYVTQPQETTVVETQPTQEVSNDYFHENLSPYGAWIEVDGYGRVWRPTVVVTSPGWQPYRDRGRWVYTQAGWYWLSDYSWGSITFHYGRWFSHPRWGWCWWPDTVWAPSWVTWRYDNAYCGWAPLPPWSYYRHGVVYYRSSRVGIGFDFGLGVYAYTYVPWSRFHDPRPYYHCLPRARSVAIHRQTTVVTDIGSGNNHAVVNRGIPRDRVREHTRTDVRPVALREDRSGQTGLRPARLERDGSTLVVTRPPINQPPTAATAATAGERGSSRLTSPARPGAEATAPTTRSPERTANVEARRDPRPTASGVGVSPAPLTPSATVNRPAPRDTREVGNRPDATAPERSRPVANQDARAMETTRPATPPAGASPTPAQGPTPIFTRPVVMQTTPQLPNRPIGTPPPSVATPPSSTFNGVTSRSPGTAPPTRTSQWQNNQVNNVTPSAPDNRAVENRSREATVNRPAAVERPSPSLAPERSARPEINAPVTRPAPSVTPPRAAPAQAPARPSFTPAPARPSYTPPPAAPPAAAPRAESRPPAAAPRVESRPPAAAPRVESRPPPTASRVEASRPSAESRPASSDGARNPRGR
jgi:hypothetical protein